MPAVQPPCATSGPPSWSRGHAISPTPTPSDRRVSRASPSRHCASATHDRHNVTPLGEVAPNSAEFLSLRSTCPYSGFIGPTSRPQASPQDLARRGLGNGVDDLDLARVLVGRHAFAAIGDEVLWLQRESLPQ